MFQVRWNALNGTSDDTRYKDSVGSRSIGDTQTHTNAAGLKCRDRVVDGYYYKDKELAVDGFSAAEGVGWENVFSSAIKWGRYWSTRYPSELLLKADSDTQITLTWSNNGVEDYDSISIERSANAGVSFTEITTGVVGTTTISDATCDANTEYYYRIRYKKDDSCSAYSDTERCLTYATILLSKTGEVNDTATLVSYVNTSDITKDENNLISKWANALGIAAGDFTPSTDLRKPLKTDDAVSFNGTSQSCSAAFGETIPQTWELWIVFNTVGAYIAAGTGNWRFIVNGVNFRIAADTLGCTVAVEYNRWIIMRGLFKGATSSLTKNEDAPDVADIGTNGLSTCMLGATRNNSAFGAVDIKTVIIRRVESSAQNIIDIYSYIKKKSFPAFDKSYVLFTSDGNGDDPATGMAKILNDNGVKGTFYIYKDCIAASAGWWTYAQMLTYHNDGFDMMCHSKTHPDLRTLTEQEILDELTAVNEAWVANGLPSPKHHAYPFGYYNDDVKAAVAQMRLTGRAVGGDHDSYAKTDEIWKDVDKYLIRSENIDYTDDTSLAELKTKMDLVHKWKGAMTLYTHGVNDAGEYSITPAYFSDIVQYAISIGMTPITISQFYELLD